MLREVRFTELKDGARFRALPDDLLRAVSKGCGVMASVGSEGLRIEGGADGVACCISAIHRLADVAGAEIDLSSVAAAIRFARPSIVSLAERSRDSSPRRWVSDALTPRSRGQAAYLNAMELNCRLVGVGGPGSGKTALAVSRGLFLLRRGEVDRLIVVGEAEKECLAASQVATDLCGSDLYARMAADGTFWMVAIADLAAVDFTGAFVLVDHAERLSLAGLGVVIGKIASAPRMVIAGRRGGGAFDLLANGATFLGSGAVVSMEEEAGGDLSASVTRLEPVAPEEGA